MDTFEFESMPLIQPACSSLLTGKVRPATYSTYHDQGSCHGPTHVVADTQFCSLAILARRESSDSLAIDDTDNSSELFRRCMRELFGHFIKQNKEYGGQSRISRTDLPYSLF